MVTQYLRVISSIIVFLMFFFLPFNIEAYTFTIKDREYLAESLTRGFLEDKKIISCNVMGKKGTTLEVISALSPDIDGLVLVFSLPDKKRRLKSYGFKKVVIKGIGWENGVSQGVKNIKIINIGN